MYGRGKAPVRSSCHAVLVHEQLRKKRDTRRDPRRVPDVLLVAIGGALGTLARAAVSSAWPGIAATFVENILGAFLLGLLAEALARRGPETLLGRKVRLTVGTGVLGGFTTFSALALAVQSLTSDGRLAAGVGYGLASLLAGAVACVAGIALAGRGAHR